MRSAPWARCAGVTEFVIHELVLVGWSALWRWQLVSEINFQLFLKTSLASGKLFIDHGFDRFRKRQPAPGNGEHASKTSTRCRSHSFCSKAAPAPPDAHRCVKRRPERPWLILSETRPSAAKRRPWIATAGSLAAVLPVAKTSTNTW